MQPVLSRSVEGKVIFVTGGGSGIGRATVGLLAREGAQVAFADINRDALEATHKELQQQGVQSLALPLDVSDAQQCADAVQQVVKHYGTLYGLVNNAGISAHGAIDAEDYPQLWERALAVLLSAHTALVRASLEAMRKAGTGRIVNIASTEGLGATPGGSAYTAAKHGVIGLTRALAVELGRENITVNCVCPGPVHTGMTQHIQDEHKQAFARRRVPLRRYASPEEIAHGILHLLLPASSYINGVALPVDGGMTVKNA